MATTMAQFDVFVNPVPSARSTYPFVVAMQADFAHIPTHQMVAPATAHSAIGSGRNRLTPKLVIRGTEHVVLVPHMSVVQSRDLTSPVDSLALARGELLAAIDLLFFGA
jgi:hypothetical protein